MSHDGTGTPCVRQNKAKKCGRRLTIAYALRGAIFFLLALMIVLMVCGVLHIREHLAPAPENIMSVSENCFPVAVRSTLWEIWPK